MIKNIKKIPLFSVVGWSLLSAALAFAQATPISRDVQLKSAPFAQLVYQALEKTTAPRKIMRAGGTGFEIQIGRGLSCSKQEVLVSRGRIKTAYSCSLLKGAGWKAMGMESYGCGDNGALAKAIYDALGVAEEKDVGLSSKVVALDRPDASGGTERNMLSCVRPTLDGEKLGLRATCQVINAL